MIERGRTSGLVGRVAELDRVQTFVDGVRDGGGTLLVSGEAGLGKTALLEEAVLHANQNGCRVVRASGAEFEVDITFATINQLLGPFLQALPQLEPAHREALRAAVMLDEGLATDPALVSVATLALLLHEAARQPVLLIVDDLPWLDRASARVLAFVSRRLAHTHVGLLAATRSGESGLFEQLELPTVEVKPLDEASSEALLEARFPALTHRVRRRLLHDARGNPLALLELPVALMYAQRSGPRSLPSVLPLTQRLRAVFATRVGGLPGATRDLLLLAALDGTGDLRVLHNHSDNSDDLGALAPAERARLVVVDPGVRRLEFRHPLIRSAVVDLSTEIERRRAHTTLAARLRDDLDRRAWHLAAAAIETDESVAALLDEAAHRAIRRGDPVRAVAAFVRAADLSTTGTERSRRLAQAAYLGANVTGDLRNVPLLLAAARRADQDWETSLVTAVAAASHILNEDGDLDTAHGLLANAFEMLTGPFRADDPTLTDALQILLLICSFGGRPGLWTTFDKTLARLVPKPPPLLSLLSSTIRDPARTAQAALGNLDQAIADLHHEQDPSRIVQVAKACAYLDRIGGCREALWRVVGDGRNDGAIASAIDALFLLGNHAYLAGQWDELEMVTTEGLQLCSDHHYRLLALPGLFLQGLVAAARGDDLAARAMSDRMSGWAAPRRLRAIEAYTAHVECLAALGRRDFESAYLHAATVSPAGKLASHAPHALWLVMDLTEAAVRTGRRGEAAAHVAAANEAGIADLSPRLRLLTLGAAAIAARPDKTSSLFAAALETPEAEQWPFDYARIQLAYGERLRRARRATDAQPHLMAAVATFRRLGAQPWLHQANRELRATGKTHQLQGPGHAVTLTPQQRQVAELAAEGRTNKEIAARLFLSPRTVSTHLYELFPKLGITSRAALRDALDSLGPAPQEPPVAV